MQQSVAMCYINCIDEKVALHVMCDVNCLNRKVALYDRTVRQQAVLLFQHNPGTNLFNKEKSKELNLFVSL